MAEKNNSAEINESEYNDQQTQNTSIVINAPKNNPASSPRSPQNSFAAPEPFGSSSRSLLNTASSGSIESLLSKSLHILATIGSGIDNNPSDSTPLTLTTTYDELKMHMDSQKSDKFTNQAINYLILSSTENNSQAKIELCCEPSSSAFETRIISLRTNIECKVGRQFADNYAFESNAIFECYLLSRNHAVLWYSDDGKFWVKDTKSVNGTFVNETKLGTEPVELHFDDILKFGSVESSWNNMLGGIIARVKLYGPNICKSAPTDMIAPANTPRLSEATAISRDMQRLKSYVKKAQRCENYINLNLLKAKHALENEQKNSIMCNGQPVIDENLLLQRINLLQKQLQNAEKHASANELKDELLKLLENKNAYQHQTEGAKSESDQDRCSSASDNECQLLRDQRIRSEQTCKDEYVEFQSSSESQACITEAQAKPQIYEQTQFEELKSEKTELELALLQEQEKEALAMLDAAIPDLSSDDCDSSYDENIADDDELCINQAANITDLIAKFEKGLVEIENMVHTKKNSENISKKPEKMRSSVSKKHSSRRIEISKLSNIFSHNQTKGTVNIWNTFHCDDTDSSNEENASANLNAKFENDAVEIDNIVHKTVNNESVSKKPEKLRSSVSKKHSSQRSEISKISNIFNQNQTKGSVDVWNTFHCDDTASSNEENVSANLNDKFENDAVEIDNIVHTENSESVSMKPEKLRSSVSKKHSSQRCEISKMSNIFNQNQTKRTVDVWNTFHCDYTDSSNDDVGTSIIYGTKETTEYCPICDDKTEQLKNGDHLKTNEVEAVIAGLDDGNTISDIHIVEASDVAKDDELMTRQDVDNSINVQSENYRFNTFFSTSYRTQVETYAKISMDMEKKFEIIMEPAKRFGPQLKKSMSLQPNKIVHQTKEKYRADKKVYQDNIDQPNEKFMQTKMNAEDTFDIANIQCNVCKKKLGGLDKFVEMSMGEKSALEELFVEKLPTEDQACQTNVDITQSAAAMLPVAKADSSSSNNVTDAAVDDQIIQFINTDIVQHEEELIFSINDIEEIKNDNTQLRREISVLKAKAKQESQNLMMREILLFYGLAFIAMLLYFLRAIFEQSSV